MIIHQKIDMFAGIAGGRFKQARSLSNEYKLRKRFPSLAAFENLVGEMKSLFSSCGSPIINVGSIDCIGGEFRGAIADGHHLSNARSTRSRTAPSNG